MFGGSKVGNKAMKLSISVKLRIMVRDFIILYFEIWFVGVDLFLCLSRLRQTGSHTEEKILF